MAEEVKFSTQTGGNITDAEEADTTTAGSGVMAGPKVAVSTDMVDIVAGTGVHTGDKGINPTLTTPKKD